MMDEDWYYDKWHEALAEIERLEAVLDLYAAAITSVKGNLPLEKKGIRSLSADGIALAVAWIAHNALNYMKETQHDR